MKRARLTVLILFAILFCAVFLDCGGAMYFLPRYQQRNLLGLSKKEVIDRLGEPSFDPSKPFPYRGQAPASWAGVKPEWTSEAENGPLFIGYSSGWTTCRIEFENDRVVEVRILGK
jgi:hypothetical protein